MSLYHYTMCGLDYVYLRNGYRDHDTAYGPGISIEKADALDRVIATRVLTSHARLRGQEVRFLRSLLARSQADLAARLGVKRITVARWEGGPNTPIPGPADRLLRLFTAHALFEGKLAQILVDLLPEISDARPDEIVMVYVPADREAEPSLFPDDAHEGEQWRPMKAA
jgi:DNA-binding transcriptional regulator YiaG